MLRQREYNTSDSSKRLDYIDFSKGVGITLVVAGHLLGEGGISFPYSNLVGSWIYSFHMPLFFILSGFTLSLSLERHKDEGYSRHVKRIALLLAGFVLWSVIYLVLLKMQGIAVDYHEWVVAAVTLRGRAPIWFLAALAIAQLVYLPYRKAMDSRDVPLFAQLLISLILAVGITAAISYALSFAQNLTIEYTLVTLARLFPAVSFLSIGAFLHSITRSLEPHFMLLVFGTIALLLVFAIVCFFPNPVNMHTAVFGNLFLFFLNAVVGSTGIIMIAHWICSYCRSKVFVSLGKYSLGVMVLHYPPYFPFFNIALLVCSLLGVINPLCMFIICLVFVLVSTFALTWLIKKRALFL